MYHNKQSYCVIIPSHKRVEMLKRALESVYQQTLLPDAIYLVIDEPENVEKYTFLEKFDERIRVSFTGGGCGGAKARNIGLDQSTEEFVFFLDDDDEWMATKIEKQIALLDARPDAVGVTCGRTELIAGKLKHVAVITDESRLNRRVRAENLTGSFSQFGFRRAALPDIRLVDELSSAQDFEFYMRLTDHGRIVVVPECLILYYRHGEGCVTGSLRNKISAYRLINQLHLTDSTTYELKYRTYQVERLWLNSEISFINFLNLAARTTMRGVLFGEPILALKYVIKSIVAYFCR